MRTGLLLTLTVSTFRCEVDVLRADVTILMRLADPDLDHDAENSTSNYPHQV